MMMNSRNRYQPPEPRQTSRTRGALGLFFNPNFGTSLSVLRDTGRIFIQLVAMIFAQANLIDKRHPAVTGATGQRFGLFELIALAYEKVEWRQENIAQISMFLAVCISLGLCALGVVYAIFSVVFVSV